MTNKTISYCYRVHNYEQYLHDVGELRAMGYSINDRYNAKVMQECVSVYPLWLHIDYVGDDGTPEVCLHNHAFLSETVPNLEFIINELPVVKSV